MIETSVWIQILRIAIGYSASVFFAAALLFIPSLRADDWFSSFHWFLFRFQYLAENAFVVSFVPAIISVIISEYVSNRKLIIHLILGAVASTVAIPLAIYVFRFVLILPITGALSAGLYWLIAGRYAGMWRKSNSN
jgi:hypothetical protein